MSFILYVSKTFRVAYG